MSAKWHPFCPGLNVLTVWKIFYLEAPPFQVVRLQQFIGAPESWYTRHQDMYRDTPTLSSPVPRYIIYLYFIVYIQWNTAHHCVVHWQFCKGIVSSIVTSLSEVEKNQRPLISDG